jgi:hypothetical protein
MPPSLLLRTNDIRLADQHMILGFDAACFCDHKKKAAAMQHKGLEIWKAHDV